MALNYDNITSIIKSEYIPKLEDNYFNSSYLFQKMKAQPDMISGGKDIHQPLQYAKGRSGWYSEWDLLDVSPKETRTAAVFEWGYGYANITISKQQELKAAGSDHEVVSLIRSEMTNAEDTLIEDASEALYNDGSDSTAPHGLRKVIGYDRTLGGIDSTTETWWDSNVAADVDSNYTTTNLSATNLTNPNNDYFILKVIRTVWMKTIHKREKPDAIYVSEGVWNILEEVLQPYQNYPFTKATQAAADAGFEVLQFRGRPILWDEYCTAGYIFMINSNYFKLKMHSQDKFQLGPWQKPVNQQSRIAQITVTMQFVTGNPRYLGVIQCASAVG
ncbi:MAG: phage major capsid protein [Candidatus Hodarchaeota archaeon]